MVARCVGQAFMGHDLEEVLDRWGLVVNMAMEDHQVLVARIGSKWRRLMVNQQVFDGLSRCMTIVYSKVYQIVNLQ